MSLAFRFWPAPAITLIQLDIYPEGHILSNSSEWFRYVTPDAGSAEVLDVAFYPVPASEMATLNVVVYSDEDLDGQMDAGEVQVEFLSPGAMTTGEWVTLILYQFQIPSMINTDNVVFEIDAFFLDLPRLRLHIHITLPL